MPNTKKRDDDRKPAPAAPKTVGETAVRKPHEERMATESGGTSGAEDTTRLAGYVADISKTNEPPPGPPVPKDAALTPPPEKTPPPPPPKKP